MDKSKLTSNTQTRKDLGRQSVVLFETNLPFRQKLANYFKAEGLVVFEMNHASDIYTSFRTEDHAPSLMMLRLDRNREALELAVHRLLMKYNVKIPVVVMAKKFDTNDLLPLVEMGTRSVLLNLESEANWQGKVKEVLELIRTINAA